MCFQHTKQKKGLQVKKSKIKNAGLGLYATKDFQNGQKIADYGGVVVSFAQYEKNPSGYGIHLNKKEVLDGKSTQSGLARYANNCRKVNKQKGGSRASMIFQFDHLFYLFYAKTRRI